MVDHLGKWSINRLIPTAKEQAGRILWRRNPQLGEVSPEFTSPGGKAYIIVDTNIDLCIVVDTIISLIMIQQQQQQQQQQHPYKLTRIECN